jgi:uncharacterized peroxidase-related enzyme
MSRIETPTTFTAPTASRPLIEALAQKFGRAPNLFATIGHSPAALSSLLGAMDALSHGELNAAEIEAINLHVSELNGCAYCVAAHGAIGKGGGLSPDDIANYRKGVGRSPREDAILAFCRRIVRTGGTGAGTELAGLRETGVSDGAIIEIITHVALKAMTNAVAIVAQTEVDFPRQPHLPSV